MKDKMVKFKGHPYFGIYVFPLFPSSRVLKDIVFQHLCIFIAVSGTY